ncbi:MAG: hypothetical protein CME06_13645 [Gemmatimonadetes bacterium]|nr:hypothetical protein [Gemmatimonadota bacterium]
MMLSPTALAITPSAALGTWHVTGNTDELENWTPEDGAAMADGGVAPEEIGPVILPVPGVAPLGDYKVQVRTGDHGVETRDTRQVTVTVTP